MCSAVILVHLEKVIARGAVVWLHLLQLSAHIRFWVPKCHKFVDLMRVQPTLRSFFLERLERLLGFFRRAKPFLFLWFTFLLALDVVLNRRVFGQVLDNLDALGP